MGGSDMCEWSYVGQMLDSNPLEYAKDLGREVGCDPDYGLPIDQLVECLRFKHHDEIVNASAAVYKKASEHYLRFLVIYYSDSHNLLIKQSLRLTNL